MMNAIEGHEPGDQNKYISKRSELLSFIPQDANTLLDVGCSSGNFGAGLKNAREIEVWGVEPNIGAAKEAESNLDRVLNAPFTTDIPLPDKYFDVVAFFDSLEHFPDPYPALDLAKQKLNGSGVVIASIPNVRYIENVKHFLIDLDWKYEEEGIRDRTHLRFFTVKSMRRTFEEAGYVVLSVTGIHPHYWTGKKIFLLRLFFAKWIKDMKYMQYVIVAKPADR